MAAQSTEPIEPGTGLEWTGIAIGAALLGGTSAYGRRGGIFGTLLAVTGLTLFLDYSARRDLDIALFAIAAATLGAGLVVTRLIETYGRPLPVAGVDDDWQAAAAGPGTTNWTPDLPETWTPVGARAEPLGPLGRRTLGIYPMSRPGARPMLAVMTSASFAELDALPTEELRERAFAKATGAPRHQLLLVGVQAPAGLRRGGVAGRRAQLGRAHRRRSRRALA